jgi:hypothetical protein
MKNLFDRLADAFREEPMVSSSTKVTIAEIVKRKSSVVLFDGKLYRITAEEMEVPPK